MKIKLCYVSNSSSSSTTVSFEAYKDVFELAIHSLQMIIKEEKENFRNQDVIEYEEYLANLVNARKMGLDPNISVYYKINRGYGTYIVKIKDGFYFETYNEYELKEFKKPYKDWIDGGQEPDVDFYYLPKYDVLGKEEIGPDKKTCRNKHFYYLILKDGRIICPICKSIELKSMQISNKMIDNVK